MEEYFESVTPTRWSKPALVIKPKERIAAFKQCRAPKPEWQWSPLDNFGVLNEIDQQYCKDGQAQPLPIQVAQKVCLAAKYSRYSKPDQMAEQLHWRCNHLNPEVRKNWEAHIPKEEQHRLLKLLEPAEFPTQ